MQKHVRDMPRSNPCCVITAEIGIGLTGLGFLFLFLGVLFFFDKGLIALGNVRPIPALQLVSAIKRQTLHVGCSHQPLTHLACACS